MILFALRYRNVTLNNLLFLKSYNFGVSFIDMLMGAGVHWPHDIRDKHM